jgi:hypothetical protein
MPSFNADTPKPAYVYDSNDDTWYPLVGIAPSSRVDQFVFTATSGQTSISGVDDNASTLAYTAGTEQVYLNGVLLVRNSDYTASNGTSITGFSPALATNDVVEIITYNPSNIQITDAILETDINAKGDLIAGTADNTAGILSVGTNGQYLKADSGTATGLAWSDPGDLTAVSAGTGITVTSGTGPIPSVAIDTSVTADLTTAQTLTNKTLTNPIFIAPEERLTITAASATGTINIDTATSGTLYYTNSASSNHVINVRHSSNTSLNNILATGDSVTVVWLNTNGATAFYPTVLLVDSATSGVSTKWQGGTAPSAGNASSVDAYVYNIMKTGSAAFTVLASQTKFA